MYDAIVLAGGSARRLGGVAKPQLDVGGVRLLDLAVDAVADAGVVVVVGPAQPLASARAVQWCREEPPGGGPVAALAAAMPYVSGDVVVLLAADLPRIAPAVPLLVDAVTDGGVARLVDPSGRVNHLASAWDRGALLTALGALGDPAGASMHALASGVASVDVADTDGWGLDCDTPADLDRARDGADRCAIEQIVATFFAAFTSGSGSTARLDVLRALFLPAAVIVRTCGTEPAVYDVESFIAPRQALLGGGALVDFREWELSGHTEIFGDIAHHFGGYAKAGTQDGIAFTGRGMKTMQFVRMPAGWRISAVAWDDERDGLTLAG